MSSTGTKATGFATADLGPFKCQNCQKWKSGVCMDNEVAADPGIPGREQRLTPDGHLRTDADECCNEFLSLKDKGRLRKSSNLGQRLMALGR
jgi:hypothetical protein